MVDRVRRHLRWQVKKRTDRGDGFVVGLRRRDRPRHLLETFACSQLRTDPVQLLVSCAPTGLGSGRVAPVLLAVVLNDLRGQVNLEWRGTWQAQTDQYGVELVPAGLDLRPHSRIDRHVDTRVLAWIEGYRPTLTGADPAHVEVRNAWRGESADDVKSITV